MSYAEDKFLEFVLKMSRHNRRIPQNELSPDTAEQARQVDNSDHSDGGGIIGTGYSEKLNQ